MVVEISLEMQDGNALTFPFTRYSELQQHPGPVATDLDVWTIISRKRWQPTAIFFSFSFEYIGQDMSFYQ